jgi:regulatory protein YycI of two-component signal transduction system YycFG
MDWSKTTSIFIMVFLILDIFLLYQFLEKKENYQYEYMTQASIEERLEKEEIKYVALSKQKRTDQFLLAQSKTFVEEEVENLPNQQIKVADQTMLTGTFYRPFQLSKEFQSSELEQLVKGYLLNGKDYRFWSYDEANGVIIFYQTWDQKMFFNNSKGKITLYVNQNHEVISYEQTYLEKMEKFKEQKEVVPAIKAIEVLYLNGDIQSNNEITKVELGYYNSLQTTSATHLLVPVWRVVVNDKVDLFVNAFDRRVITLNTEEKIME